ncbi:MAG: universal stress protein [Candidatus Acidiferrales bacterium]
MIPAIEMTGKPGGTEAVSEGLKIKKILVATDFSIFSDRAMEYALAVARRYRSQIFVTHILSLDPYAMVTPEIAMASIERLRQNAARHFTEMQKSEKLERVPYEVVIEEGPFWPTLESVIEKNEIDFIVAGTRGAGAISKLLIGSSAEEIFRQARVPVLTVGPGVENEPQYEAEFRHILFATDFGLGADREAEYAFSLAQQHHSKLTVLHVIAPQHELSAEAVEMKKRAATQQMRELIPATTKYLCWPQFRATTGDAVEEILRVAKESKADLIIMGAKRMKAMADHKPHTTAYRIVTASTCPVLTIRS